MTTIVEARGRGGQLLERFRTDAGQIRIGRAFDNDLILDDPYVSPHHLTLVQAGDGWLVNDLGSLNGYHHGSRSEGEADYLHSGDRVRIGHTELYVYHERHVLPEALPVDGAEARFAQLGGHRVWPVLILMALALFLSQAYFKSYGEFRWMANISSGLDGLLTVVVIAAFWALVGRLLRHRAAFLAHLSIWMIFGMLGVAGTWLARLVAYNLSSGLAYTILDRGFGFVVQVIALWGSLLLATTLARKWRLITALGVSAAFLAFGLIGRVGADREFSSVPEYYGQLMQPLFRWAPPAAQDQVAMTVPRLVERVDEEAARLAAEAAEAAGKLDEQRAAAGDVG
jgi:hypothetical protein